MTDPIQIIEQAYQFDDEGESDWLARLALAVRAGLGRPEPLIAWTYQLAPNGYVQIRSASEDGLDGNGAQFLDVSLDEAGQHLFTQWHLRSGIEYARRTLIDVPGSPTEQFYQRLVSAGFADMLSINSVDPTRHGCLIGLFTSASEGLHHNVQASWQRICAHITTAYRLRRRLAASGAPKTARLEAAEAVLESTGQLRHAVGPASSRTSREALRAGARALDQARGALRKSDAQEAVEAWQGLIAGRWSLIDHFDSDGRRYIVAHQNDPQLVDPRGLTTRERQLVAYAELGRSNKDIAYELGLAPATVSVHLTRAREKLKGIMHPSTNDAPK